MGCFEHGKMVFFGFVFCQVLMLKGLFLVCLALFQKCQKCLFSQFWGAFLGWLIVVHLGLEGLGVFVFLVFVSLFFCVAFVSVLFALILVLWLDVVFFLFVIFWFVYFAFFVLFFLEGLRVR